MLVCAGAGGVGKTTTAAALAMAAAKQGRRAIVVTIDPAKRLKELGEQFEKTVDQVAGIEKALGIHDLARFTAK